MDVLVESKITGKARKQLSLIAKNMILISVESAPNMYRELIFYLKEPHKTGVAIGYKVQLRVKWLLISSILERKWSMEQDLTASVHLYSKETTRETEKLHLTKSILVNTKLAILELFLMKARKLKEIGQLEIQRMNIAQSVHLF